MKYRYYEAVLLIIVALGILVGCTNNDLTQPFELVEPGVGVNIYEDDGLYFSGTLKILVEDAKIYKSLVEANITPDDIHDFSLYSDDTGNELSTENKILLVDFSIENVGAVNSDTRVSDEFAFGLGFLCLTATNNSTPNGSESKISPEYYGSVSDIDSIHENYYHINEGESINITIGYIIDSEEHTNYFIVDPGEVDNVHYLKLDL